MHQPLRSYGSVDGGSSEKFKDLLNRVNKTASMNCRSVFALVPLLNSFVCFFHIRFSYQEYITSLTQLMEALASNNDHSHHELLEQMNLFLITLQKVARRRLLLDHCSIVVNPVYWASFMFAVLELAARMPLKTNYFFGLTFCLSQGLSLIFTAVGEVDNFFLVKVVTEANKNLDNLDEEANLHPHNML